jgi:hypothetical protein
MKYNVFIIALLTSATGLLSACQSTPKSPQIDRDAYLEQFLGQSSQFIRSRLNLKQLGYQQVSSPTLNDNELNYIVQRPVAIPLPVAQFPVAGTGVVPIPVNISASSGYDYNLICKITFKLKDNIAESVQYTGRTC